MKNALRLLNGLHIIVLCLSAMGASETNVVDSPSTTPKTGPDCQQLLDSGHRKGGHFPHVAHMLHSLTVRDLRRYFDPNATAVNYVPTVNHDLLADRPILMHAPDLRGDGDRRAVEGGSRPVSRVKVGLFAALTTADFVLSHIHESHWDARHFTPIERLIHAFHMEEMWLETKEMFDRLTENPASDQLCVCAMDIWHNGLMEFLKAVALGLREPVLVYGQITEENYGDGGSYPQNSFRSAADTEKNRHKRSEFRPNGATVSEYPEPEIPYRPIEDRHKRSVPHEPKHKQEKEELHGMPHLETKEAWRVWKSQMMTMGHAEKHNAALFMHCAVRKVHQ